VINAGRRPPLAYTTVMTVLARLHRKGLADRAGRGRGFVYRASLDEQQVIDQYTASAVDAVLARYGQAAVRHFTTRLVDLDPELRAALERLAEAQD
jgi:predicted transcriptional regulator